MAKKTLSFANEMKAMARKATQIDAAVESGELDSAIFSGSPDSWTTPDSTVVPLEKVVHSQIQMKNEDISNCSFEAFDAQPTVTETEQVIHYPPVVHREEPHAVAIRNRTQEVSWFPRTKMQRELASYLKKTGTHITTLGIICMELNVGISTLRNLLRTFNDKGLIKSQKHYSENGKQGLYIKVINLTDIPRNYEEAVFGINKELHEANIQAIIPQSATRVANEVSLLDKQKDSLLTTLTYASPLLELNKEDILFHWPELAKIDFGPSQIRQIHERLAQLGRVLDAELCASIRQGLTHANAALELADGTLRDHKGNPISNPRAYIFTALARDGYYTAPKGYLSPETCRLRDEAEQNRLFVEAEKELKVQQAAKQDAEREGVYFQWREALSEEELSDLQLKAPSHAKKGIGFEKWLKLSYYPELES